MQRISCLREIHQLPKNFTVSHLREISFNSLGCVRVSPLLRKIYSTRVRTIFLHSLDFTRDLFSTSGLYFISSLRKML